MPEIIDIGLPNYAQEYDGYMLMKFTTCYDYQQDFLNGLLYFNTTDNLAKCEDEGRGDIDEGSTFIVDSETPKYISANLEKVGNTYAMVVRDYSSNPEAYQKGTVFQYSSAINRRRKIISLYTMFVNIKDQRISSFDSRMKKEFGEYGILILDRQEFYKRVLNALSKSKEYSQVYLGFVDYVPKEKQQGIIDWTPFLKKQIFDYQNEFRVTFVSEDDQPVKLDLGCSLRDIAAPIMMDDLGEIYFEEGKLLYPKYIAVEDQQ